VGLERHTRIHIRVVSVINTISIPICPWKYLATVGIKSNGVAHLLAGHGWIELTVWVMAMGTRLWPLIFGKHVHMDVMVILRHPTSACVYILEIGPGAPCVANQVGLTVTLITKGKIVAVIESCIVKIVGKPQLLRRVIVEPEVSRIGSALDVFKNLQDIAVDVGARDVMALRTGHPVPRHIVTSVLIVSNDIMSRDVASKLINAKILRVVST
jgi:hypothetical protein